MRKLLMIIRDEDGQGMVEYGLIVGLVAVIVSALALLGPSISKKFTDINDLMTTEVAETTAEPIA